MRKEFLSILIIFNLFLIQLIKTEEDTFNLVSLSPGLFALSLSIGYPMHTFLLLIDTSSDYTWVRGTNCTFCSYAENIYDEETSISAIHQDDIPYTTITDIKGSVSGNILLDDIKIGEIYATKVELLIVSEDEFLELADGVLSLKFPSGNKKNSEILTKLYQNGSIQHKIFSINIKDEMTGYLTIGNIPKHILEDKINYSKCHIKENNGNWNCLVTHILFDNEFNFYKAISVDAITNFSTGVKGIYMPLEYLDMFLENYFKKLDNFSSNKCTVKKVSGIKQILCLKTYLNLIEKDISFILNGIAYSIPFENLFEDVYSDSYNKYKLFSIQFMETPKNEWYFGTVFLKEHEVVFNGEDNEIGFYGGFKYDFTEYTNEKYEKKCLYNTIAIMFLFGLVLVPMAWTIYSKRKEEKYNNLLQTHLD